MCALVRIPGYQVSFKNCPKEFDIREMAARRACDGPALYTHIRSLKPIHYMGCADHSKFGWMHLLFREGNLTIPISIRRFVPTYYPCTQQRGELLNSLTTLYFSILAREEYSLSFSIQLGRYASRRFFDPSNFFPSSVLSPPVHGRSTVYRSSKLPLPAPPLGGFACGSSTVSLVE